MVKYKNPSCIFQYRTKSENVKRLKRNQSFKQRGRFARSPFPVLLDNL